MPSGGSRVPVTVPFGEWLRQIRKYEGIEADSLGAIVGFGRSTMMKIERGELRVSLRMYHQMKSLARIFEIDPALFLFLAGSKSVPVKPNWKNLEAAHGLKLPGNLNEGD